MLLLLGILLIAAGTFFFWKERKAAASVTNNRSGLADRNSGLANGSASGLNGNPVHSGAAGSSGAHAILRGMTGSYAGQSFDLLKGKVTIGRDPTFCNIVYEKSTPGISSRHCQLSYNPGESCFVLTDLGSSYGTFLGNGKKLAPNVPEKALCRRYVLPLRSLKPFSRCEGIIECTLCQYSIVMNKRDLCPRALGTNSTCTKSVRRNERTYDCI